MEAHRRDLLDARIFVATRSEAEGRARWTWGLTLGWLGVGSLMSGRLDVR